LEFLGVKLEELQIDNVGSWPELPKRAILTIACIITFMLGYAFDLSGKIQMLDSSTRRVVTLSALYIDTNRQVLNLESYRDEVDQVEHKFDALTTLLPDHSDSAGLLEDISQVATSCGVQFVAIKPGAVINQGFYQESATQFSLAGNYSGFGEFVSSISTMPRLVTLHDFVIRSVKNDQLVMDVLANTYWSTPEAHHK